MGKWKPTCILKMVESKATSTNPIVVDTDCGRAILKVINNPEGPHALAREWIGTNLADLFGLSTFDIAILNVTELDELPMCNGQLAKSGPAFAARWERGTTLGGSRKDMHATPYLLRHLDNPDDLAKLVIFDTWILNKDRYAPAVRGKRQQNRDNVWASREDASAGNYVLKAIDHTSCISMGRDLSPRLNCIDMIQHPGVFGLFPEFRKIVCGRQRELVEKAAKGLKRMDRKHLERIVNQVPDAWELDDATKPAIVEFLMARAQFVSDNVCSLLWPQWLLPYGRKTLR